METEELLDYQKPVLRDVMFRKVLMGAGNSTCTMHAMEQPDTGTEVPSSPEDDNET